MNHRGHDDGYRPGHVDHRAHERIREHGLRVCQVRPHGGEPLVASEQHLAVQHGHGVNVDVAHPGVGDHLAHRLVHRRVGGQPRAEVEELADARRRGADSRLCLTSCGSAGFTSAIRQPISLSDAKLSVPPSQ
jgi:hypothetical protein